MPGYIRTFNHFADRTLFLPSKWKESKGIIPPLQRWARNKVRFPHLGQVMQKWPGCPSGQHLRVPKHKPTDERTTSDNRNINRSWKRIAQSSVGCFIAAAIASLFNFFLLWCIASSLSIGATFHSETVYLHPAVRSRSLRLKSGWGGGGWSLRLCGRCSKVFCSISTRRSACLMVSRGEEKPQATMENSWREGNRFQTPPQPRPAGWLVCERFSTSGN